MMEAKTKSEYAEHQAAVAHIERYFEEFPEVAFNMGDNSFQTLRDMQDAGPIHPDYDKLLNLNAVADRAAKKGISMIEAHVEMFGKRQQEEKAKETIKEEQAGVQQEKPGKTAPIKNDD